MHYKFDCDYAEPCSEPAIALSVPKGYQTRVRNPTKPEVSDQKSEVSNFGPAAAGKTVNDPADAGVTDPIGSAVFLHLHIISLTR